VAEQVPSVIDVKPYVPIFTPGKDAYVNLVYKRFSATLMGLRKRNRELPVNPDADVLDLERMPKKVKLEHVEEEDPEVKKMEAELKAFEEKYAEKYTKMQADLDAAKAKKMMETKMEAKIKEEPRAAIGRCDGFIPTGSSPSTCIILDSDDDEVPSSQPDYIPMTPLSASQD
jgi:hypothetical protein